MLYENQFARQLVIPGCLPTIVEADTDWRDRLYDYPNRTPNIEVSGVATVAEPSREPSVGERLFQSVRALLSNITQERSNLSAEPTVQTTANLPTAYETEDVQVDDQQLGLDEVSNTDYVREVNIQRSRIEPGDRLIVRNRGRYYLVRVESEVHSL